MADRTYQVRVYVRRSDGRIFGYSVDRIPDVIGVIEAVDEARHVLTAERDWCFDGEGWEEASQPACVRQVFTDPRARGWVDQWLDPASDADRETTVAP